MSLHTVHAAAVVLVVTKGRPNWLVIIEQILVLMVHTSVRYHKKLNACIRLLMHMVYL
jgi:hypothetical protein